MKRGPRTATKPTYQPPISPAATEKFDRNAYQAAYMRDVPKAKAMGLTVAAYRAAMKEGK